MSVFTYLPIGAVFTNIYQLSTGKILEENLFRSAFHQTVARHWKTSLVFVVEPVFKIHCSTEAPYR
jgi:hypothetical protein